MSIIGINIEFAPGARLSASEIRFIAQQTAGPDAYVRVIPAGQQTIRLYIGHSDIQPIIAVIRAIAVREEVLHLGHAGEYQLEDGELVATKTSIEVADEYERRRAAIRLWLDPGEAPPQVVAAVLNSINALHRAAGGSGLEFSIDRDGSLVIAEALT